MVLTTAADAPQTAVVCRGGFSLRGTSVGSQQHRGCKVRDGVPTLTKRLLSSWEPPTAVVNTVRTNESCEKRRHNNTMMGAGLVPATCFLQVRFSVLQNPLFWSLPKFVRAPAVRDAVREP